MTPELLLADARRAFEDGEWGRAAQLYHQLDHALVNGGVLPPSWRRDGAVTEIQRELDSHPTWTPIRSGEPSRGSW